VLEVYDLDNCSTWDMQPDGHYVRRQLADGEVRRGAQDTFIRLAEEAARLAAAGTAAAAS
jgi:hypothetical protein